MMCRLRAGEYQRWKLFCAQEAAEHQKANE